MMKSITIFGIAIYILLGENLTSANDQQADEEDMIPPALTCVAIGDAGCDRMCKMVGHIYATPVNPAKCSPSNICECSMREHKFLDDLWAEKFTSTELMNEIHTDRKVYREILKKMKATLKTREQSKHDLGWYLTADQYARLQVNDNVAENMIKYNGHKKEFDRDNIRAYVSKSLRSDPLQLPEDFCYKSRLSNALENVADADTAQFIIHDVRQTENPTLNEIVDNFINEKSIQEDKSIADLDGDDVLPDILDLMIVNEFISPSPIQEDNHTNAINESTPSSDSDPWDLPNLDIASVQEFDDGYKCWTNEVPEYSVCQFKAVWGEHHIEWKKGKVSIDISTYNTGRVTQKWKFEDGVNISLVRQSNGNLEQTWSFGPHNQLKYVRNGDVVDEKWSYDNKDEESLTKYKSIIKSWCDKNRLFIEEKSCVIY
ncbi:uncharacterized protein LOC135844430 [Planococcus citri]|uniref:uncharacterized protein LOC135844430 n=1 Tax=Planococcus citri TaxID=170843 RepID=UPI0031F88403